MRAQYVVVETVADGTQNVWGPFATQGDARQYLKAMKDSAEGKDTADYFVTILGTPCAP